MKDTSKKGAPPRILPVGLLQGTGVQAEPDLQGPDATDSPEGDGRDHADREEAEAFWAGRNHAMRRSARIAA